MIGFDGCVDSIIAVVDKRHGPTEYDPVDTIEQFGKKVLAAAGHSSNYELVVKQQKIGGNAAIMANAMAALGVPVTCVGALGAPDVHPVFADLAGRAECVSFAEPGCTDALEFNDGKLMLGKIASLTDISWQRITETIGEERFTELLSRSRLIGMVNWTMLSEMGGIWDHMIDHTLPAMKETTGDGERRRFFVDLADPEKRTPEDLRAALVQCSAMGNWLDVTLAMNLKESLQVGCVLGLELAELWDRHAEGANGEKLIELAGEIRQALDLDCVVIHPRAAAAAVCRAGNEVESAVFAGPFVAEPKISTGGGDHFNAGFSLGRLAGMPLAQCLCAGTATSGYYVRSAKSPTLDELAGFCADLPDPEK